MRRSRCAAANGDIAHKPMTGVTLLRLRRSHRSMLREHRNAACGGKTHSSMHIVTPCDHAARRSPGSTSVYTMFDVDLFIPYKEY